MQKWTQEQLEATDYSKLLKVMLKNEHKIFHEQENGQWMISVENTVFTLRMRLYVSTTPLDALTMGVPTWSLRVTNNEGRQVMYVSSLQPQVSSYLGKLIMDAKDEYKKKSAEFDYANLEEYIKG